MDQDNLKIPLKDLAPEGTHSHLYIVPQFDDEKTNSEWKLKDNEYRDFHLIASLNKSTSYSLNVDFNLNADHGNSYLMIPEEHEGKKILNIKLYTPAGHFLFHRNKSNELSLISFDCKANNTTKALEKFYNGITPYLDYLSYKYNVPVSIDKVFCEDKKNGVTSISYVTPYIPKSAVVPPTEIPKEMIPIFALFREAKMATSPYYQFLCYFKILEGIYRKLRPELIAKAKLSNVLLDIKKEIVPPHPELLKFQPRYIGQSIYSLFQKEFEKEYRNAVSHFALKDGTMINLSDYNIIKKYQGIIALIEICCREVIENQFKFIFKVPK